MNRLIRCTRFNSVLLACLSIATLLAAAEPRIESSYLRAGDRIVFFGDSITEQASYTLPIEIFLETRCPELKIGFVNSGWGGDRAWGGEGGILAERLERDLIRYEPDVVTVMLGMNDGYYTNFDAKALAVFRDSIEELINTLHKELPRVRITLIGTSPYDDITAGEQPEWERIIDGGYDSVVVRYSQAMGEIAKKHDLLFVDMHKPLVQLLKRLSAEKPELARELIPDRIHPGKAAGLVMAAELLNAWHVPVADLLPAIDVRELDDDPLIIQKRWPARFPLDDHDTLTTFLLMQTQSLKFFAPPRLRITGLRSETVFLKIDDCDLGVISASELAAGLELSGQRRLADSADDVARLIEQRNRLQFLKWRTLEVSMQPQTEQIKQAAKELAAVEKELGKLQASLSKPRKHLIEIRSIAP